MKLRRLSTRSPGFDAEIAALTRYDAAQDAEVQAAVRVIIAGVRARGDAAVLEYAARFDKASARSVAELEITRDKLRLDADTVAPEQLVRPVAVTERGVVTGEPERFHSGAANGWQRIVSWAGPWPVDEQWWSEDPSGRAARFQLVGADGRAWLVLCRDGQWWTEAAYE